ncbi:aminopeptidase N [Pseudomonadota bacterium]
MKKGLSGKTVYREKYKPYPWTLENARFRFEIGEDVTRVFSTLRLNPASEDLPVNDIELDGQDMELCSIRINGEKLQADDYSLTADKLIIQNVSGECTLDIEVLIRPQQNTALEGLYPSSRFLLTQCEAEGFRKITYFPDRPDVMTCYDVTIVADQNRYPVLLSNGNAIETGSLDDGRHWVRWSDPFAKPCYLFALVAGDLACIEDHFTTRSGRLVTLRVHVEHENRDKCDHAMESLIHSMKWDEDRFDLEYDLDIYHIVATDDFNMGAMENKSLNIFNSKYVLARPDTATDFDYQGIEGVIGHEYFHNWTGNRVTCQDWFQLTLKEGLTVFRDQEFSSDMHSRAVKRIQDVRQLRSRQFPEDAGPMSHPIRPDKYIEINNFYTMTVYQKGAEIIRMYHTLLGEEGFQKGMKLYFQRHDGHAVTCDDFLAAMADANQVSLDRFGRWYGQSGTPELTVLGRHDPDAKTFSLTFSQHTPSTQDQEIKQPLVLPVEVGLLDQDGRALELRLAGEHSSGDLSRLLLIEEEEQEFIFEGITEQPIPSLLRGFSAPVKLDYPYSSSDLAVLMAHDTDAFVRWEAAQLLAQSEILAHVSCLSAGIEPEPGPELVNAFQALLADQESDPALIAEAMTLPGEDYLAEQMEIVDVDGIHRARKFVKSRLAAALETEITQRYQSMNDGSPYSKAPASMARRSLKNVCLSLLLETNPGISLAEAQMQTSDNMTDTLAALQGLVWVEADSADRLLAEFEDKWSDDALVMDKWFSMQAALPGKNAVRRVRQLLEHPGFSLANPNKVRSVIGVFSMMNPTGFHAADGSGYRLHAEQVIALDKLNPQVAARMAGAFNAWTRYDAQRRKLMKEQLNHITHSEGLSPDVAEIINNALAMEKARSKR